MFDPQDIELIQSQRKGMRIKVLPGKKLEVRAPFGASLEEVLQVLQRLEDKLQKMFDTYDRKHQAKTYEEGSAVLLFGKALSIRFAEKTPYAWKLENDCLWIKQKYAALVPAILKDFYTEEAKRLKKRAVELQEKFGFPDKKLSTRWNKSRWGSCSPKGSISLNIALVMAPWAVIDYVIVHEYCHIRHPNHSREFWLHVSETMPEYHQHRDWLKKNGYLLRIAEQA